jgi:hypothetical protein
LVHTERHHDTSTKIVRKWQKQIVSTYSSITSNFRVVFDVANHILTPYERVVVIGLELIGDKPCPSNESL